MTTIDYQRHPISHADAVIRYIGDAFPEVCWKYKGFTYEIEEWINDADPTILQPSDEVVEKLLTDIKNEQILFFIRQERDKRLSEADKIAMKQLTTTGTVSDELKQYMQSLRDIPQSFIDGSITDAYVDQTNPLDIHLVWDGFPVLQK